MAPPSAERPLLEVADRAELRAWLEANHTTSAGVQLAVGKKGGSATALTYDDAVEEALCFGWIDSTARTLDHDRYTILFTPRKPKSVWSSSNKKRVERLAAAGLMTPAGLAAVERAKANGSWEAIGDVEAMVMPKDLATAFAQDPQAQTFWDALPPGQRRLSLYSLAQAKRPETREARIEKIVTAAREGRRLW